MHYHMPNIAIWILANPPIANYYYHTLLVYLPIRHDSSQPPYLESISTPTYKPIPTHIPSRHHYTQLTYSTGDHSMSSSITKTHNQNYCHTMTITKITFV